MAFLTFLVAAVILAITPGPGIAYVVARTAAGGRAEGLASCIGTGLGGLLHVAAAAVGLSMLVAQSATAFSLVKYLGAAYLVYLGLRLLLQEPPAKAIDAVASHGARRALCEGIVVEALNVKTALFFLAFLPQFVDPAGGAVALQILQLGGVFMLATLITFGAIALLAGRFGQLLQNSPRAQVRLNRAASVVFASLALRLVWAP